MAENDDATTAEVTEAITNLSDAIANLKTITLDTSALEHEIELVTEMIANLDNYCTEQRRRTAGKAGCSEDSPDQRDDTGRDRRSDQDAA